jgi:hypothetical protein
MKTNLSDIYEQILLNEAEKSTLQNPSSDEVGNLTPKSELFGEKPKAVEGPEKAKLQQGPSYKETTGTSSAPKGEKAKMPNSAPAKETKGEKGEEMEDTDVDPTNKKEKKEKKEINKESFTMSAFETLFKKTLNEEIGEPAETAPEVDEMTEEPMDTDEMDTEEQEEESLEDEEGDLVSDLRDLQDKLSSILSKLEDAQGEEESLEGEEEYTEDDFDDEFDTDETEEAPVRESLDKPKPLNSSKGKQLMSKKNKVGRVNPKGGKAHTGNLKSEPKPKALGDRKGALMKGKAEVKSSIKKGDFIK